MQCVGRHTTDEAKRARIRWEKLRLALHLSYITQVLRHLVYRFRDLGAGLQNPRPTMTYSGNLANLVFESLPLPKGLAGIDEFVVVPRREVELALANEDTSVLPQLISNFHEIVVTHRI